MIVEYSEKFRDYFLNTHHAGAIGGDNVVVLTHQSSNPFDQFRLFFDIREGVIIKAHFEASSTPALIAAGEYVCRWLEGKSTAQAAGLQKEQILQELVLDQRFIHIADLIQRLVSRIDGRECINDDTQDNLV